MTHSLIHIDGARWVWSFVYQVVGRKLFIIFNRVKKKNQEKKFLEKINSLMEQCIEDLTESIEEGGLSTKDAERVIESNIF